MIDLELELVEDATRRVFRLAVRALPLPQRQRLAAEHLAKAQRCLDQASAGYLLGEVEPTDPTGEPWVRVASRHAATAADLLAGGVR